MADDKTKFEVEFTVGGIKEALKELDKAFKKIRKLSTPDLGGRISELQASIQKEIDIVKNGYEQQLAAAQKSLSEINKKVKESFRQRENLNRSARKVEKLANQQTDAEMKALYQQLAQGERKLSKQKTKEYNLRKQQAKKVEEEIKNIQATLANESYRDEANTSKLKQKLSELQKKKVIQDEREKVASIKSQLKEATKAVAEEKKKEIQANVNALNKVLNNTKSVYNQLNQEQKKSVEERIQDVANSYIQETRYHSKSAEAQVDIEKRFTAIEQKLRNRFAKEELQRSKKATDAKKKQTEELTNIVLRSEKQKNAIIKAGYNQLSVESKKSVDKQIADYRDKTKQQFNLENRSSKERIKIEQMLNNKIVELVRNASKEEKQLQKDQLKTQQRILDAKARAYSENQKGLFDFQTKAIDQELDALKSSLNRKVNLYSKTGKEREQLERKINSILDRERKKLIDEAVRDNKRYSNEDKREKKEQLNNEINFLRRKAQLIAAGEDKLTTEQKQELDERVKNLRKSIVQETGLIERGSKKDKAIEQELYLYKKKLIRKFVQDNKKSNKKRETDTEKSNKKIEKNFRSVFGKLRNVASASFSGLTSVFSSMTMQLQMLGSQLIKTGIEFDNSITTLAAIRGETREGIAAFEDQARLLGSTTLFTATQAAEGMQALARAGLETSQVITVSSDALKFAGANATTMYQSTSLLAATMKQFNLVATSSGRIVDTFTAATQNSMFDVESLAVSMRYAGNVGSSLGAELEETVGVLAQFRDMGLEGSMVGTRFRQAMLKLSAPTMKAKKAMDKLSISYDSINPAKVGLIDALRELARLNLDQEALVPIVGSKVSADFNKLIQDIRSTAEMDVNTGELIEGTSKLEEFIEKLYEARGVTDSTYAMMVDSVSGNIKILTSQFEELQLTIFDALNGKAATEIGAKQFTTFSNVVKTAQKVVSDLIIIFDELGLVFSQIIEQEFTETFKLLTSNADSFAATIASVTLSIISFSSAFLSAMPTIVSVVTTLGSLFASTVLVTYIGKLGQLAFLLGGTLFDALKKAVAGVKALHAAQVQADLSLTTSQIGLLIKALAVLATTFYALNFVEDTFDGINERARVLEERIKSVTIANKILRGENEKYVESLDNQKSSVNSLLKQLKDKELLDTKIRSNLTVLRELTGDRATQLEKEGKIFKTVSQFGQEFYLDQEAAMRLATAGEKKLQEAKEKGIKLTKEESEFINFLIKQKEVMQDRAVELAEVESIADKKILREKLQSQKNIQEELRKSNKVYIDEYLKIRQLIEESEELELKIGSLKGEQKQFIIEEVALLKKEIEERKIELGKSVDVTKLVNSFGDITKKIKETKKELDLSDAIDIDNFRERITFTIDQFEKLDKKVKETKLQAERRGETVIGSEVIDIPDSGAFGAEISAEITPISELVDPMIIQQTKEGFIELANVIDKFESTSLAKNFDISGLTDAQVASKAQSLNISEEELRLAAKQQGSYSEFLKLIREIEAGKKDLSAISLELESSTITSVQSYGQLLFGILEGAIKKSKSFKDNIDSAKLDLGGGKTDAPKTINDAAKSTKSLADQLAKLRKKSLGMIADLKSEIKVMKDATQEGVKGLEKQADAIVELAEKEQKLAKRLGRSASRRLDTFERMTENISLLIERTALKTEKEYMKSYDSLKNEIRELTAVQSDAIAKIQQEENKRLDVLDNVTNKSFNQAVALIEKEAQAVETKYKEMESIVKKFGKSRNASNKRAVQKAKQSMMEIGNAEQRLAKKQDKIRKELEKKEKRRAETRIAIAELTNQKILDTTKNRLIEIGKLELQANAEDQSIFQRIETNRRESLKRDNETFKKGVDDRKKALEKRLEDIKTNAKKEELSESEKQKRINEAKKRFREIEEQQVISHNALIKRTNRSFDAERKRELDKLYKEIYGTTSDGYNRLYGVIEDGNGQQLQLDAETRKKLLDSNKRDTTERIRRLVENVSQEQEIRRKKTKEDEKELSKLSTRATELNKQFLDTQKNIQLKPKVKSEKLKEIKDELSDITPKINTLKQSLKDLSETEIEPYSVQSGLYEKIIEKTQEVAAVQIELDTINRVMSEGQVNSNKKYLDSILETNVINGQLTKSQIRQLLEFKEAKKRQLDSLYKEQNVYELKAQSLLSSSNKKQLEEEKKRNVQERKALQENLDKLLQKKKTFEDKGEDLSKQPQLLVDIELLQAEVNAYTDIISTLENDLKSFGKPKVQVEFETSIQSAKDSTEELKKQLNEQNIVVEKATQVSEKLVKKKEKLQEELLEIKPQKGDKRFDKKLVEEEIAEKTKEIQKVELDLQISDDALGKAKIQYETLVSEHEKSVKHKKTLDDEYEKTFSESQRNANSNVISQEQALLDELAFIHQENHEIRKQLDKDYGTFVDKNGKKLSRELEDFERSKLNFQMQTNEKIVTAYESYQDKIRKLDGLSAEDRQRFLKQHASELNSDLQDIQKDFTDNYPKAPELKSGLVLEMDGFKELESAFGVVDGLFTEIDKGLDVLTDTSDENFSKLGKTLVNVGTFGLFPLIKSFISGQREAEELSKQIENSLDLSNEGVIAKDVIDELVGSTGLGTVVFEAFSRAIDPIGKGLTNLAIGLKDFLMSIPAVKKGIESISDRASKIGDAFSDSSVSGLQKTGIALKEGSLIAVDAALMIAKAGIQIVPQLLSQGAGLLLEKIGIMKQETFNKVLEVMSFVAGGVKGIVSSLISGMRSAFDTMKGLFDSAVSYMISADLSLQANITGGANAIMEDAEKAKERLDHLNEQLAKGEISQAEYNEARAQGVGTANPEKAVDNFITNLVDEAVLFMESMAQAAPLVADKLLAQLPRIIEAFKTSFPTVLQALATGIPQIIGMAIQGINEVLPSLLSTISEALPQVITNIIKLVQDSIVPLISTLGTAISTLIDSIDFGALIDNLSTALFALLDSVLGAIETLVGKLPEIVGGILKKLPDLITKLSTFIANLVTTLGEVLPDIINQFFEGDTLSNLLDSLLEGVINIGVAILAAIPDLITAIIIALPKVTGALVRAIPTILTAFVNSIPVLLDALIRALPDLFMAILMYIPTLVGELWKFIMDGIGGFGKAVGQAILDGLSLLFKFFRDLVTEIVTLGAGETETFGDTPGAVKAPSDGLSARFKGGDFVVAAQKPQEVLRQALELMNNTGRGIPINSQVMSEFSKLANTIPSVNVGTENILGSLSKRNFGIQSPTMGMRDIIESMGKATGFAMRSAISQAITPLVQAQNMQRPTAETGSFRPINLSVVADGRVLDSVQVSAMNSGNAPKLKRKIRNMSGVNVGFSRGRYNNFSK